TPSGGVGNDTYRVQEADDVVSEGIGAGNDLVISTLDYGLAANVERLALALGSGDIDATGNGLANILTGNEGANQLAGLGSNDTLIGGAGNDTLDGGTGGDAMIGGAGDDRYLVDAVGDAVNETLAGSSGTDTVVSFLASYALGTN